MDRLRNRRGLRSRSRKSHVGANMLDAAGFTEDEKQEAFRIYDETLKADREREERQMRTALESLVDDRLAHEAEETLRTAPLPDTALEIAREMDHSGDGAIAASFSASAAGEQPVEGGEVMQQLRRRIGSDGEPESDEELRRRIMEEFMKDADRALEGREGERERQSEAMKRRLEEQRRRRREKLVEQRVAAEIKNATTNEARKEGEAGEDGGELEEVASVLKEAADAIEATRAEMADGDAAEKRSQWNMTGNLLQSATENQVMGGRKEGRWKDEGAGCLTGSEESEPEPH